MPKRFRTCPGCNQRRSLGSFKIVPSLANAETKAWAKVQFCSDCQIARASAGGRRHEMRHYGHRDSILRRMGFSSYAEYLASDLWQRIRSRVLKLRGYRCQKCGRRATQVHHNIYGPRELKGQSLKGMKALCDACHGEIEFDGRRKVGVVEASHRFYN